MNRRQFLGMGAAGGMLGLAGCVSRIKCVVDGDYDHLNLKLMPEYVAEYPSSVILHYRDLSSAEQRVVDRATSRGDYKQCHAFDGEPNGIMKLGDHIQQRWTQEGESEEVVTHTYLEHEGEYYGISIVLLDVVLIDSIPVECNDEGCHSVTPTPPASSSPNELSLEDMVGVEFGTSVTFGDGTLTLSNPRVRKAIAEDFGIWQEVRCDDGQYLLVEATTEGAIPTRFNDIDLTSIIGEETVVEDVSLVVEGRPGDAPRDPSKWNDRLLAFYFPDKPVERAAIRWKYSGKTADWDLGTKLRKRLLVEPAFELQLFEVSADGDDVRVHIRVKNSGERAGDFLGQFSFKAVEDDSSVLPLSVPKSETTEFRGVPPILSGIAANARVVTLAYSGIDGVSRVRREL